MSDADDPTRSPAPGPQPLRRIALQLGRFLLTGATTTAVAYGVFMGAGLVMHYALASLTAWVVSVPVGFLLNRRFTFEISDRAGLLPQFVKFAAGSTLQLALNEVCLFIFIGQLGLSRSLAFGLTLAVTASSNFLYLRQVTFRARHSRPPDRPGQ